MTKNNLTAEQQQQLKELGGNLHRIRVAKNISLDDVAANTHISKRLLAAIEAGDTTELPEPFYIQALVSKFARQIGAEEVFEVDRQSLEEAPKRSLPSGNRRGWWGFQLRTFHLYLIYILLVIASVKAITSVVERPVMVDRTPVPSPIASSPAEREQPAAIAVEPPKAVPQLISQSSNTESVSVDINLQERCWLKVMVDGQVAFEGVLPQGTQRQWTGRKQVTIRAGNAGGVAITFNNQQQKILGAPGQVEEVTYTVN